MNDRHPNDGTTFVVTVTRPGFTGAREYDTKDEAVFAANESLAVAEEDHTVTLQEVVRRTIPI